MTERILVFDLDANLWAACEQFVQESVGVVTNARARAGLLVAGGATLLPFYERAGDLAADIFPTDERMVGPGNPADTSGMLQREWGSRFVTPQSRIVPVPRQADAAGTAAVYSQMLREWAAGGGGWAAALLGVGGDGHIASLFPGQLEQWGTTEEWVVAAQPEQEPMVPRVTVTPSLLAQVPRHIVVITGSDKIDITRRWLKDREPVPAQMIHPVNERIILLDRSAARDLDAKDYEYYGG
jgi:6-phosphogluconolactonase